MIINFLEKCSVHQDDYHYLSYNSHFNEIAPIASSCGEKINTRKPMGLEIKMFEDMRNDIESEMNDKLKNILVEKTPADQNSYDLLTVKGRAEIVVAMLDDDFLKFFKIRNVKKDLTFIILEKWTDNSMVDLYLFVAFTKADKKLSLFQTLI